MKHVVIVGAGFAGVRVARKLRKQRDISVTIINSSPDFKYNPAWYRAATGKKMGTARLPLEWMLLDDSNVDLVMGTASKVDIKKKLITLEDGTTVTYDIVVFALGSITTYFNIEGLHEHAFGIKTAEEVTALRKHLHDKILNKSKDEANYVVIGAGPTGVEVSGVLGSYLKRIAKKHKHKAHNINIWLVDSAPRILPQLPVRVSKIVERRLKRQGVKMLINTMVKAETLQSLKTSKGTIKTHTVIWTAGVATNPFFEQQGDQFSRVLTGKVHVNKHLEAHPGVYVIGDNAATKYSGLALTAVWHGDFVAKDIIAHLHHKKRPTKYEHRPVHVVPAGDHWAILEYGWFVVYGRLISLVRSAADYIGYKDLLGYFRALTIWTNSERPEDACEVCHTTVTK